MRDTIDMAEEAGAISYWHLSKLKAFEALVRADERDRASPVQEQIAGFDVVLDESMPPNTMKFVQPAPKKGQP